MVCHSTVLHNKCNYKHIFFLSIQYILDMYIVHVHCLFALNEFFFILLVHSCKQVVSSFFLFLFLFCIFGYLVILIFYKWIAINVNSPNVSTTFLFSSVRIKWGDNRQCVFTYSRRNNIVGVNVGRLKSVYSAGNKRRSLDIVQPNL